MTTTPEEFETKYPAFVGLADDFSDPPPSHTTDEILARKIRQEWGPNDRIEIFEKLLGDTDRILTSIDSDWEALGGFVSRHFMRADDARKWLLRIRSVWLEELAHLKKGGPDANHVP